jgi:hypothetical protein
MTEHPSLQMPEKALKTEEILDISKQIKEASNRLLQVSERTIELNSNLPAIKEAVQDLTLNLGLLDDAEAKLIDLITQKLSKV